MVQRDRIPLQLEEIARPTVEAANARYGGEDTLAAQGLLVSFPEISRFAVRIREDARRTTRPLRHLAYRDLHLGATPFGGLVSRYAVRVTVRTELDQAWIDCSRLGHGHRAQRLTLIAREARVDIPPVSRSHVPHCVHRAGLVFRQRNVAMSQTKKL